jgi:sulfate transport system substrate-binding protein
MKRIAKSLALAGLVASVGMVGTVTAHAAEFKLLNVSYDPTRELYQEYNAAFAKHYLEATGDTVTIEQSHGGSGKQAQAVIDGLGADVVTLALAGDINAIVKKSGLIAADWQSRFELNATPYSSTIVFLVRKGNPKGVKDWADLVKPGIEVITPNPKTSGGARWNYLAAWAYANRTDGGDEQKTIAFVKSLYANVPVLDTGARGSTTTFAQKELGDVLTTWENEAYLVQDEFGKDNFEIVTPSLSIRAEPPVAVVDKNAEAHGTTEVAKAYLDYLYSAEGQTIAAKNHYRPSHPELVSDKALVDAFPQIDLVTIDDPQFGGWGEAQPKHFGEGGIFDQIHGAS